MTPQDRLKAQLKAARPRTLTSTLEVRCSPEEVGKRLARLLAKPGRKES